MVRIRMKSFGRRHRPFFRICAMDSRTGRDGRAIEELGHYDPMAKTLEATVVLDHSRTRYWLSVGAQPSEKVRAILTRLKVTKPGPGEDWNVPEPPPAPPAPPAGSTPASGMTPGHTPLASAGPRPTPAPKAAPASPATEEPTSPPTEEPTSPPTEEPTSPPTES